MIGQSELGMEVDDARVAVALCSIPVFFSLQLHCSFSATSLYLTAFPSPLLVISLGVARRFLLVSIYST